jgi:hypothetical protein
LGDLPERAGVFLAAGFRAGLAAFFAGLDGLAVAFGREDFVALAAFFELFFFGELAIFSEAPLVCRARAEAYLKAFPAGRKRRFPR